MWTSLLAYPNQTSLSCTPLLGWPYPFNSSLTTRTKPSSTKREYLEMVGHGRGAVVGTRGGGEQCGNEEMEAAVVGGREFGCEREKSKCWFWELDLKEQDRERKWGVWNFSGAFILGINTKTAAITRIKIICLTLSVPPSYSTNQNYPHVS